LAAEIFGNRQHLMAVAAQDCMGLTLVLAPDHRRVTGQLLMAAYAGVKCVAALESHGHNIALRVVVRTLSLLIDADSADYHLTRRKISYVAAI
jgi:hypothetical protein